MASIEFLACKVHTYSPAWIGDGVSITNFLKHVDSGDHRGMTCLDAF